VLTTVILYFRQVSNRSNVRDRMISPRDIHLIYFLYSLYRLSFRFVLLVVRCKC